MRGGGGGGGGCRRLRGSRRAENAGGGRAARRRARRRVWLLRETSRRKGNPPAAPQPATLPLCFFWSLSFLSPSFLLPSSLFPLPASSVALGQLIDRWAAVESAVWRGLALPFFFRCNQAASLPLTRRLRPVPCLLTHPLQPPPRKAGLCTPSIHLPARK